MKPKTYLPPIVAEYQRSIYEALNAAAWRFLAARSRRELLESQAELTMAVAQITRFTALASGLLEPDPKEY